MEKRFTLKEISNNIRYNWPILASQLSSNVNRMCDEARLTEYERGLWDFSVNVTDPTSVRFSDDRIIFVENDCTSGLNEYLDLPYEIIDDETSPEDWAKNYVAGLVKYRDEKLEARKAASINAEEYERRQLATLMAKYPDMVPGRE